jgi:DNA-binding transcriptional regulator LsrR (DeoR family)
VPLSGLKGSVGQRTIAILKRLLDGMPQTEIAKEMSISRQRVHAVAREAELAGIALPE